MNFEGLYFFKVFTQSGIIPKTRNKFAEAIAESYLTILTGKNLRFTEFSTKVH